MKKLKVITMNIAMGEGRTKARPLSSKVPAFEDIKTYFNEICDKNVSTLIGLQEVHVNHSGSGNIDQPAEIARSLSENVGGEWRSFFNVTTKHHEGMYGDVIITNMENVSTPVGWGLGYEGNKKRAVVLKVRDQGLYFINTHLGYKGDAPVNQTRKMIKFIQALGSKATIVLVGDFNVFNVSDSLLLQSRHRERFGKEDINLFARQYNGTIIPLLSNGFKRLNPSGIYTYSSWDPTATLDYIFMRSEQKYSSECTLLSTMLYDRREKFFSDHNGLMVDIAFE